jgi:hypothetical protein
MPGRQLSSLVRMARQCYALDITLVSAALLLAAVLRWVDDFVS